jgi:hypothetical protein
MSTAHRAYGFRFMILVNEHGPEHVHVFGNGGEAKIFLDDPAGPRLDRVVGISRNDMRKLMKEADRERGKLLKAWSKIHG